MQVTFLNQAAKNFIRSALPKPKQLPFFHIPISRWKGKITKTKLLQDFFTRPDVGSLNCIFINYSTTENRQRRFTYVSLVTNSRPEGDFIYIRQPLITVNKITSVPVNWNISSDVTIHGSLYCILEKLIIQRLGTQWKAFTSMLQC